MNKKQTLRLKRHARIRHTIAGTPERPRLSIYRGIQGLQVQLIDDVNGKTLVSGLSHKKILGEGTGIERAKKLGLALADMAKNKGISVIVFDRGGFRYHGQVKAFADSLRESGMEF